MNAPRRQSLLALLVIGAATCLPWQAVQAATPALDQILQQCQRDPAYRVGGAAMGECLEAATAQREKVIARQLQALSNDHCASIATARKQSQQHWQDYRLRQCGLYQAIFDNTASYINGAACQLRFTLQREAELQQLVALQPSLRDPCQ